MSAKIVVATDLSDNAALAARWAQSLADRLGDTVVAAHIIEIGLASWWHGRYEISVNDTMRTEANTRVCQWYLDTTGKAPAEVDLRVQSCLNGLTEVVKSHAAEMLVMSPTSKSAIAQFVVGSRVQAVANRPPCPLAVVTTDTAPTHIAVATDFSAASGKAVHIAANFARRVGAQLTVLHVTEVPDLPAFNTDLFAASFADFEAEAQRELSEFLSSENIEPSQQIVLRGQRIETIEAHIKEQGVDLIVVGQTGCDSVLGDLLGSVPRALIHHRPCSVLVVPS